MDYHPGDIILEKYRLAEGALIGQGAFGDVYRVTHINLKARRAIKILRRDAPGMGSSLYNSAQQRFLLEGQLGAMLNSPVPNTHLLQVYDFIIREDLLLLEMEYAAGGSLSQRIQRLKTASTPFPLDEALQIAAQIATGLMALHEKDIVHRDLKPANILFDEHSHARLADLGLAQIPGGPSQRSQLSEPAPHPGTPGYMSPEQENTGKYLTPASDIYSLGVTLFETLTGRIYHSLRPGTLLSKLRTDATPHLDDLLVHMLAETPKERPWDGAEAAALLNEALAGIKAGSSIKQTQTIQETQPTDPIAGIPRTVITIEDLRKAAERISQPTQAEVLEKARVQRAAEEQYKQDAQTAEIKRRALTIELAPGVNMEFVRVHPGEFLMGSDKKIDKMAYDDETPQHRVTLNEYLIGKYPVTNRQYQAFVQAVGYVMPRHWKKGEVPNGKQEHPVVYVSWNDAVAFCEWASHLCGQPVRLPSEAEWEKAARGTDGRIYPWGNQAPDELCCNFNGNIKDTMPVGLYSPRGDSVYGCADMAGNVWEWVWDWYAWYATSPSLNPTGPASGKYRVIRGGSWAFVDSSVRSTLRGRFNPADSNNNFGFRCARSQ